MSNESAQKVFFDNLVIHHDKGYLLEEDQYYPFGLRMAGISDEALPIVPNNYLYNGKEFNNDEFSDGTGLGWYSYGMREYDPQLARFPQLDPLTDEFPTLTPYQYASNDPIDNIDKDGLAVLPTVSVFATDVNRMSPLSAFTSSIAGTANLGGKIMNFTNIGLNLLRTGGYIDAWSVTKGIGTEASNLTSSLSTFVKNIGNGIDSCKFVSSVAKKN